MKIGKGRTEQVSRGEQKRDKGDKKIRVEQGMIRNIGSIGGLGVDSEVKDRTGLNTVPCPVDFEIGKAQWAWAHTLAKEGMDAEAEQKEFKLWPTEKGERMNQSFYFMDILSFYFLTAFYFYLFRICIVTGCHSSTSSPPPKSSHLDVIQCPL